MLREVEEAEGYFSVDLGERIVDLPELSYRKARAWSAESAVAFGPAFLEFEREWKPGDGLVAVEAANAVAMDVVIEALVRYDETGVLGGAEAIGDWPASRIYGLYRQVYEAAHPFDADLKKVLSEIAMVRTNAMIALVFGQLVGETSTSGSSPAGDSLRAMFSTALPLDSLSSSGGLATADKPRPKSAAATPTSSGSSSELSTPS